MEFGVEQLRQELLGISPVRDGGRERNLDLSR